MNKVFFTSSLRRSGQHAIINWIAHQSKYKVIWYENINIDKFKKGEIKNKQSIKKYHINKKGDVLNIHSLESLVDINEIKETPFFEKSDVVYISIIRDVYNYLSSYMRWKVKPSTYETNYMQITNWINSAKDILDQNSDFYPILYNNWFSNKEYRNKISDELGLNKSDVGIDQVLPNGLGSSFDGLRMNGKGSQMNVLQRYKNYLKNPDYINALNDLKEAHELNKEIFGFDINDIK